MGLLQQAPTTAWLVVYPVTVEQRHGLREEDHQEVRLNNQSIQMNHRQVELLNGDHLHILCLICQWFRQDVSIFYSDFKTFLKKLMMF